MSTAEYKNNMSDIQQTDTPAKVALFAKLHKTANVVHTADMDEIRRFKSIMDKLMTIESDIKLIKRHFNIVTIIGGKK